MRCKHDYVCINCPMSCTLELTEEDGEVLEVRGAGCGLGEKYAQEEFRDPRRMVTTTVKVKGGTLPLVPVRSERAIPKHMVRDAVRVLADIVVDAPVKYGQVIYQNILDTGVDVLASRDLQ